MDDIWLTPSRGTFTFNQMINNIFSYIDSDINASYEIIVGTDSQNHKSLGFTKYITAVVVRKVGMGAQYFFKTDYKPIVSSLRQKIWNEAILTYETIEMIKINTSELLIKVSIVPHLDVGTDGKSKKYIDEIKYMFSSNGYDIKIKPYSYVASGVADKHSK